MVIYNRHPKCSSAMSFRHSLFRNESVLRPRIHPCHDPAPGGADEGAGGILSGRGGASPERQPERAPVWAGRLREDDAREEARRRRWRRRQRRTAAASSSSTSTAGSTGRWSRSSTKALRTLGHVYPSRGLSFEELLQVLLRRAEEGQGAPDGRLRRGRLAGRLRPFVALHDNQDQGDIAGRAGLLVPADLEDAGLPEDGRPEHAQLAPAERDIARPVLGRAALRHPPLEEPAGVPRRDASRTGRSRWPPR